MKITSEKTSLISSKNISPAVARYPTSVPHTAYRMRSTLGKSYQTSGNTSGKSTTCPGRSW
eukprot:2809612-Rhodomonas_salina.2